MTDQPDDAFALLRAEIKPYRIYHRTYRLKSGTVIVAATGSTKRYEKAKHSASLEERFMTRVKHTYTNDCWLWLGNIDKDGYGVMYVGRVDGKAKTMRAHRWSYEHFVGPIPEGSVLDHKAEICGSRHCVNPGHLEPVTNEENVRRGHAWRLATRTHCANNHEFAVVGRRADGNCAECNRLAVQKNRRKMREENPEEFARQQALRAERERERRKTPEYQEQRKAKQAEKMVKDNERRRERYANDPEYRAKILAQNAARKA